MEEIPVKKKYMIPLLMMIPIVFIYLSADVETKMLAINPLPF